MLYKFLDKRFLLVEKNLKWNSKKILILFVLTGVNFINVKCAHFLYKRLFSSYVLALNELLYEKCVHLMLMKLTAGRHNSSNYYNLITMKYMN